MPNYLHIAIGSNRRHRRHGAPTSVVAAAADALAASGLPVVARATIRVTAPLGPRQRSFANTVVAVASDLSPRAVLAILELIERDFGRRGGRRWGPRVLDLDLVAAGAMVTPRSWRAARHGLIVPHRGLALRAFVLDPLVELAPGWRHPVLHLTARQLRARLRRPRRTKTGP